VVTYLVAWREDEPVGHGLIHWPGPRNPNVAEHLPGCPEIFNLGVREALRSQGIGRLIVVQLEELARLRGNHRVGLGVALANLRAQRIYARLGYRSSAIPHYVDRWRWIDSSGAEHLEEDPCVFLVKALALP
jgi:ribosomal protein S18 acetylase RimI-like enzyme